MEYNKLVRDNIPEILEGKGILPETHIASDEEYEVKLREKLLEEVQEYLENPSIEELGDVLEVVYALSSLHGTSRQGLEKVRQEKVSERGGFEQKIVLDRTRDGDSK